MSGKKWNTYQPQEPPEEPRGLEERAIQRQPTAAERAGSRKSMMIGVGAAVAVAVVGGGVVSGVVGGDADGDGGVHDGSGEEFLTLDPALVSRVVDQAVAEVGTDVVSVEVSDSAIEVGFHVTRKGEATQLRTYRKTLYDEDYLHRPDFDIAVTVAHDTERVEFIDVEEIDFDEFVAATEEAVADAGDVRSFYATGALDPRGDLEIQIRTHNDDGVGYYTAVDGDVREED